MLKNHELQNVWITEMSRMCQLPGIVTRRHASPATNIPTTVEVLLSPVFSIQFTTRHCRDSSFMVATVSAVMECWWESPWRVDITYQQSLRQQSIKPEAKMVSGCECLCWIVNSNRQKYSVSNTICFKPRPIVQLPSHYNINSNLSKSWIISEFNGMPIFCTDC
jgi:hypothetical protein